MGGGDLRAGQGHMELDWSKNNLNVGEKRAPAYEWRRERELRVRTRLCGGRVDRG